MEPIVINLKSKEGNSLTIATDGSGKLFTRSVESDGTAGKWISSDYEIERLSHSISKSKDYSTPSDRVEDIENDIKNLSTKFSNINNDTEKLVDDKMSSHKMSKVDFVDSQLSSILPPSDPKVSVEVSNDKAEVTISITDDNLLIERRTTAVIYDANDKAIYESSPLNENGMILYCSRYSDEAYTDNRPVYRTNYGDTIYGSKVSLKNQYGESNKISLPDKIQFNSKSSDLKMSLTDQVPSQYVDVPSTMSLKNGDSFYLYDGSGKLLLLVSEDDTKLLNDITENPLYGSKYKVVSSDKSSGVVIKFKSVNNEYSVTFDLNTESAS